MTRMISAEEKIGPYDAFLARKMLRNYYGLEPDDVELFSSLGFLETKTRGEPCLTDAGRHFCRARSKRFNRKTGEQALETFLGRVHDANHNSEFFYFVKQVVLFGSMLTTVETVADVDVFVELTRKKNYCDRPDYCDLAIDRARKMRKTHGMSFADLISFPEVEVWRYIKGRSPVMSMQLWDNQTERFLADQPHKIIFSGHDDTTN